MGTFSSTFGGVVLAAADMAATVEFYRRLGLEFDVEQHEGGPVHRAHVALRRSEHPVVLEVYPPGPKDRLLVYVTDLAAALGALGRNATIRETGSGRYATVEDPDGRKVLLFQPQGD